MAALRPVMGRRIGLSLKNKILVYKMIRRPCVGHKIRFCRKPWTPRGSSETLNIRKDTNTRLIMKFMKELSIKFHNLHYPPYRTRPYNPHPRNILKCEPP